jgi:hypothetical protein
LFNVFEDNLRNRKFSKRLHKKIAMEGFTVAFTNLENALLVNCHVDMYNCRGDGYNSLIIASWLLEINGQPKRVAPTGYLRKSISDYFKRGDCFSPIVKNTADYLSKITDNQKTYSPETMSSTSRVLKTLIDDSALNCPENID